ncbi:cytochrome P450 [Dendryphion nanum]|uniref:Cytochrome P450 n=1 Tax=Dendryphion nanum TaxID=256645 RepID=A0A9P9DUD5_9PLEO|nr:cytochrome P450 [Dendryphion nanum]
MASFALGLEQLRANNGLPMLAVLSAVIVHHAVLKRYEIDHLATQLIAISTLGFFCVVYAGGFQQAIIIWSSFYTTLSASMLLYRAFFHPLQSFPGPFTAKLTSWWSVKQMISSDFTYYQTVLVSLRHKYGDYVRTGPRQISIFDQKAITPILGYNSKTTKGPFYDVLERSLHLNRDKQWHRQQRKIWDNAMKDSLSDYGPQVEDFTTELLARIQRAGGKAVPLREWMMHYAYDVMSAMAFGETMGFTTEKATPVACQIVEMISDSLKPIGTISLVPWFSKIVTTLTADIGPMKLYNGWTQQQLVGRKAMKNPKPDLMGHLLAATPETPEGQHLLFGESRLILTAGSETASTTLTLAFMFLAVHPRYQQLLRQEAENIEYSCLRTQPLLDAILYETMRLYPANYFVPQRVTPPEGLQIPDGPFIPGNIIVSVVLSALARDERNFRQPAEFIPERWTSKPELCINKSAFLPFLTGAYTCAGKNLALMEMRSVVRRVIAEYDVVLPADFDEVRFFGGIQDPALTVIPKQEIRFVQRN